MNLPSLVGEHVIKEMIELASKCPEGCFVEVGVYKGGTAQHIEKLALEQKRQFYAYDTFTGIPYKSEIDQIPAGTFNDTSFEEVRKALPNTCVIQGIFPGSAVDMPPVAFAHLDCDQYQSIREACLYLEPHMVDGGIIWFDDYGCLRSADAAVNELYSGRIEGAHCGKSFVRFKR